MTTAEKYKRDFQTPSNVAEYMVSLIPKKSDTVLEPTPGDGNIVMALWDKHYTITAPDDFFLLPKQRFDCIVMNPPFSSKFAFMENAPDNFKEERGMKLGYKMLLSCMEMSDNVIALMPWFTISDSDVRLRLIKDFGLKSITALPRKTFQYARIQTCVFELAKGWGGATEFKVFDRL